MEDKKIYVTKSFLPSMEKYVDMIKSIWENNQLTNNGPLLRELELKLMDYLRIPYLSVQTNGTLSLQIAIKALNLTGEIITTPFSYVATVTSILWEGCTPVYADIDPVTCCIDPSKLEARITSKTSAILATHVYGIPCDVEKIDMIAKKHNLKVIYDASHAFGVEYKGRSLLEWGDISTLSFHSTKLFHTVEGGATVCASSELKDKLNLLRSFGHIADEYYSVGINAKMSEFHAAMGLCILPEIENIMMERKKRADIYVNELSSKVLLPSFPENTTKYNYSYFPIIFPSSKIRKRVTEKLNELQIFPRRYFFPSLNLLPYFKGQTCPVSEQYAECVLALPLFYDLDFETVHIITETINQELSRV